MSARGTKVGSATIPSTGYPAVDDAIDQIVKNWKPIAAATASVAVLGIAYVMWRRRSNAGRKGGRPEPNNIHRKSYKAALLQEQPAGKAIRVDGTSKDSIKDTKLSVCVHFSNFSGAVIDVYLSPTPRRLLRPKPVEISCSRPRDTSKRLSATRKPSI